ncbi:MAG: hydroxymethylbilane synthase [Bacteroidia bacterium]|nr:hydroxymethylbilane synthase [Bacteroidia bacterium]MDW8301447.1 hydroxymethylbilane synthase [Bacteroidia bacterium]
MKYRIGTRGSALALWQANYVLEKLKKHGLDAELVIIQTKGDKIQDIALSKIGSKGVFTQELEQALRNKEIDLAVHSAKDVPTNISEDLPIIAFTERECPADVLVSHKNVNLERDELVIGTSSTRRAAFLKRYYPQHKVAEVRGNVQTRIKKLEQGQFDALLMAFAGIHRLGYDSYIQSILPIEQFVPAAGQGALAIQMLASHPDQELLKKILHHTDTGICVQAERLILQQLGGGCSVPIFAYAQYQKGEIFLQAGIISLEGKNMAYAQSKTTLDKLEYTILNLVENILHTQKGTKILEKVKNNNF